MNGLPSAANAVAITPDGRYLLIGSSDLYVVDTVSNAILGTGLGLSGTVQSIAVSADSSTAYVLNNLPATSSVVTINLATRSRVGNPLPLPFGGATALAISPTGLLYVSAQNAVYEIDPATMQITTNGTIALNFTPGQLRFVPDGSVAYAVNLGTLGGSINKITLASRAVIVPSGSSPSTGAWGGASRRAWC